MRSFFRDESGLSAIEFAMVTPMLSAVLLGIFTGWSFFRQNSDMHDSIEAAAKYYIQGGTNDTTAQTIAASAWNNKPSDGTVSVTRMCICTNVSVSCSGGTICSNSSVPEIHLTIAAASTWTYPFSEQYFPDMANMRESEVVRVR